MFDRFYFFNHSLSSFLHSILFIGYPAPLFLTAYSKNVIIKKDCQRIISFFQMFFTFFSFLLITTFSTSWKNNQIFRKLPELANYCSHKYFSSWNLSAGQFLHQLKRCQLHPPLVSRLL